MTEVRTQRRSSLGQLDVASAISTIDVVAPVLCIPEQQDADLLQATWAGHCASSFDGQREKRSLGPHM